MLGLRRIVNLMQINLFGWVPAVDDPSQHACGRSRIGGSAQSADHGQTVSPGVEHRRGIVRIDATCLLYTSPSPRD